MASAPVLLRRKSNAVSVGRDTCHKAKKPHLDLTFAVLKAGAHLESEGKLQLTRGNSKLNGETSGDWGLPCSRLVLPAWQVPTPGRAVQGRLFA